MLLLFSLTIKDQTKTRSDGILGHLECHLWNSDFLLWGGLLMSGLNRIDFPTHREVDAVDPFG